MSDAFWNNLPASLIALTSLFAGFYSFLAARRAAAIEQKTDAQTVVITEAKDAAQQAADHANGTLKRVEEKLAAAQQARVDDLKEGRDQAVDALQHSQPVTAPAAAPQPIVLQVTATQPAPRPPRAGDEPKSGGTP